MSKFFGRIKIASDKNGTIDVQYIFGRAYVFVNGYHQSTDYIVRMWRQALRHVPREFAARRVLMLGLGGGSAVELIRARFPGVELTVVEWDPQMIALYNEIHSGERPITILEGDASIIVPALTERYDLVIVDLFKGNETPLELAGDLMIESIARVISPSGYCLLNAFVSLELIPKFDQHFTQEDLWKYQFNRLVLYSSAIIAK